MAICKTIGLPVRGVRVSDGAKLIIRPRKPHPDTFAANNDGVTYTVTPTALGVTANGNTFRTETWTDCHGPWSPATAGPKHLEWRHAGDYRCLPRPGRQSVITERVVGGLAGSAEFSRATAAAVTRRGRRRHVLGW